MALRVTALNAEPDCGWESGLYRSSWLARGSWMELWLAHGGDGPRFRDREISAGERC